MITTNKYILKEDIFEPSIYRNYKFSKICELVNSKFLDPYISKIIYFNGKGQIDKIERVFGSWTAYPPGHKPVKPKIEVVDNLEYNDKDKIKLITTKSIGNQNNEIEKAQFEYDNEYLVQLKKTRLKDGILHLNESIFEYDKHNLSKEELRNEVDGKLKMLKTINYEWNTNNQIISKEHESIIYFENQPNLVTNESASYSYNKNQQLELEITEHKVGNDISKSTSTFRYTNHISNQIAEIKQYSEGKEISSTKYSMDENNNVISMEYIDQNGNQTLIEFKGYT